MPRKAKELSAVEVRQLSKQGRHAVGGVNGLLLKVGPGGSRSWILRVKVGDLRRDIGLGAFPDIPLATAREKAREAREMIEAGIDPAAHRKAAREALRTAQAKTCSFAEAASKCHSKKMPEFRSAKHAADWINSLKIHVLPHIGDIPVGDIELAHVLSVLQPIWETKTETATRCRQRIEAVLSWATVSGFRSGDNPARWSGNLSEVLGKPSKVRTKTHFAALPWREVPAFMANLKNREGFGARALEFAILTACRSGEVRGAEWSEIDLVGRVWTIPGSKMKTGKDHKVPLTDAAVELLEALPRTESPYTFPAIRGGKLSDVTLLAVVRRMEVPAVPHGFRSSFKDWARNERPHVPDEVSELCLAHVNSDSTRAAYARSQLLPQRLRLLEEWSCYLAGEAVEQEVEQESGGQVVGIRRAV